MSQAAQKIIPSPVAPPATGKAASISSSRLHGVDALRAFACLLVLVFHAGVPYQLHPVPGLVWPTHDSKTSAVVDVGCWWIACFIMPLFFAISGYMSAHVCRSRGIKPFLSQRVKRVLLPLLASTVTVLTACVYIWALGWIGQGLYESQKLLSLKFDLPQHRDFWGWGHLWFLEYLFLYCLALGAFYGVWNRVQKNRAPSEGEQHILTLQTADGGKQLLLGFWKPITLAMPAAMILWFGPQFVVGFHQSFVPSIIKLAYNGVFFAIGAWLYGRSENHAIFIKHSGTYLTLSFLLWACLMPLVNQQRAADLAGWDRLMLVSGLAVFAWLTTFGLIGQFLIRVERIPPAVGYIAEASYWVYLTHLPLVGLLQIDLTDAPLNAELKFLAVVSATLLITLTSYHVMVRYTWVGAFLNGRRVSRTSAVPPATTSQTPSSRAA